MTGLNALESLDFLDTLNTQRQELQETITKVLSFPQEVTRPCLVPISKVAFFPGRYIHTNEFVLDLPSEAGEVEMDKVQWKSHTQTAAVLQQRVEEITSRIRNIENFHSDKELVVVQKVSADLAPKAKTKTKVPIPTPKPTAITSVPPSTSPPTPPAAAPSFFEIREYEDEHGVLSSTEVLDMGEEMANYAAAAPGKDGGAGAASGGSVSGAGEEVEVDSALLQALRELESKFSASSSTASSSGSASGKASNNSDGDEEAAFAAELLSLGNIAPMTMPQTGRGKARASAEIDLSFFDQLEEDEETEHKNIAAMERIRLQEKSLETKRMPGSGWNKGFLGGKGGGDGGGSDAAKAAPIAAHAHAPAPAPVPRKQAFTSMIVEKNV